MTPFVERFRELGARETRSVTVPDKEELPSGEYGFFELYCNEPHCDCRRVVIMVLRPQTGWTPWAVINYGWESQEFYPKMFQSSRLGSLRMAGPGTRSPEYTGPLRTRTSGSVQVGPRVSWLCRASEKTLPALSGSDR